MNIKELRARLAAIQTEAESIVTTAESDNGGVFTEEQQQNFDALMAERDQINATIERREKLEGMGSGNGRQTRPDNSGTSAHVPGTPEGTPASSRERVEDDPMRGFSNAADFAQAVRSSMDPTVGEYDDRLRVLGAPSNFHRETGSTDGYMVPPQIRQEIWTLVFADEGILSAVMPEPTEGNSVQLYSDETTPWGNTGVQANWAAEGTQFNASRLETGARNVQLHKLFAFVLATEEILADAARLNNRLTVQAARAIRWKADTAIIEGSGKGQPLGWFASNALVTITKESGQNANTIVAQNVLKMYARLLEMGGASAFWMVHPSTFPQLATMTIGDQPMWMPPNGMQSAPGGFLMGLPVRKSDHAETLGTKGDIQLVAPQGYYAVNKAGGIDFAASMHLYFDYDIQAFRWTYRLGGEPFLKAPVSPAKGSDTRSHFITLETRA